MLQGRCRPVQRAGRSGQNPSVNDHFGRPPQRIADITDSLSGLDDTSYVRLGESGAPDGQYDPLEPRPVVLRAPVDLDARRFESPLARTPSYGEC
jgi:hypothetical protein